MRIVHSDHPSTLRTLGLLESKYLRIPASDQFLLFSYVASIFLGDSLYEVYKVHVEYKHIIASVC